VFYHSAMNRSEFFASLALPSLVVNALPPWLVPKVSEAAIPFSLINKEAPKIYNSCYLYSGAIAGFQYYDGPSMLEKLKPGSVLDLLREPENEHDYKAVAVYCMGQKLGYLARRHNLVLCNILDSGLPIYAEISRVNPEAVPYEQVRLRLYLVGVLPTETIISRENNSEVRPHLPPRYLPLTSDEMGTFVRL